MKKGLSLFLSIVLVLGIFMSVPFTEAHFKVTAEATSSGTCGENLTWTLDDIGTLTISGTGNMTNYSYASSVPWYSKRGSIKQVIINSGVTNIGDYAFYYCGSLTSIMIPDSVTSIGDYAFYYCGSLTSIMIPDNVTSIGDHAFYFCESLTSIMIPDSVTSIGGSAFSGASLTSIIIPDSVTSIGKSAFSECTSLTSIEIPDSVTSIGDHAFYYCVSLTSIMIPDSVTSIGGCAFSDCASLTFIDIPDSVTSIGEGAFWSCKSLTSIIIPDSVTSIGIKTFYECSSLTSIEIPNSVTSIGESAFRSCTSLISIEIPNSVTSIGDDAFEDCTNLKYIFYSGSESDWANISGNYKLNSAAIHYNSNDHTLVEIIINPSTCVSNGLKYNKCSYCSFETQLEGISATGHKAGSWKTDKKATVYKPGSKHKECTECGEILETAEIPQIKCSKPTLKTIANTTSGVKITWGKVSGADKYRVYRKTKNGEWEHIGSTDKTGYTDKTAKSGTKYYYAVRARNEAGNSSLSSSLSKLYLADPTLKTPTSTKSGVSLKWTKSAGAQGYIIYRKTGSESYTKLKTEKGVSNLSYVDKSAKKGKKYTYKVKAYYSKTYSAYSNTKTIKDKY